MARRRDPKTGKLLPEGIHPVVSDRTGEVTYRARISFGPRGGRRHLSKSSQSVSAAIEWRAQKQLEVNRGTILEPSQLTVADYFDRWYPRHTRDLSGSRAKDIKGVWVNYGQPALGNLKIQSVTRAHLQALAEDFLDRISANSQKTHMATFRTLFGAAVDDGIIQLNPCTGIKLGRITASKLTIWSPLQLRRFLAGTADHRFGPIWAFMIATGCRNGEARALQWDALDLDQGIAWIRRTAAKHVDGGEVIVDRTKNSSDGHQVKLEQWIQDILKQQDQTNDLVFTFHGKKVLYEVLRNDFMSESLRLGLPKIKMHGLRHSVATMLVSSGVSDGVSQSIIGHKSVVTLLNTYSHIGVESQSIGTETMARLLGFDRQSDTTTSDQKEAI